MIKIAITGTIASGKSFVENLLKEKGAATLDTDKVTHELLAQKEIKEKICNLFQPEQITSESGEINRKKLGQIVFSDKQKLKQLESIIHPLVGKAVNEFFEANKDKKLVVISVPLLFEAKMEAMFDYILAVIANKEIRINRLIETRCFTKEQALQRINAQNFGVDKIKKTDFVIENNSSIDDLKQKVDEFLKSITS